MGRVVGVVFLHGMLDAHMKFHVFDVSWPIKRADCDENRFVPNWRFGLSLCLFIIQPRRPAAGLYAGYLKKTKRPPEKHPPVVIPGPDPGIQRLLPRVGVKDLGARLRGHGGRGLCFAVTND
jgi:hypothetical protein